MAEYEKILNLWKGKNENDSIQFCEIQKAMIDGFNWYPKKVTRMLNEMIKGPLPLLTQIKNRKNGKPGVKGTRTFYKRTQLAYEFDLNSFFNEIREKSQKDRHILENDKSFIIYGIPPEKELTDIERKILDHISARFKQSFHNLLLLKLSIIARKKINQPMETELIESYIRERIGEDMSSLIWRKAWDMGRELQGEPMLEVAKTYGLTYGGNEPTENEFRVVNGNDVFAKEMNDLSKKRISDEQKFINELIKLERKWYDPKTSFLYPDSWVSKEEGSLAILETTSPEIIHTWAHNPFLFLRRLIEQWEPANPPSLDVADIFYLAKAFVNHMVPFSRSMEYLTMITIRKLSDWRWLTLRLGPEKHERLIRCIYYFWKECQANIKLDKKTEEAWQKLSPAEKQNFMGPHKFAIKLGEADLMKVERITPEILAAIKTKMSAELERKFARNKSQLI